jgi:membrane protein
MMQLPPHIRYAVDVALDVRREVNHDNAVIVAAGVAFYAVLALIPMLLLSISLYGIFTSLEEAERQVEALLEVFPDSTTNVLESQIIAIADAPTARLSLGFIASILALTWTVSNATRALVRAVKIAYDQETEKSILENRFVAIALTIAVIIALIIALALIAAVPVLLRDLDAGHPLITFGNFRWLLIGLGTAAAVGFLYRYAPPRRPDGWKSVLPGVVFATMAWTIVSIGFSIYVSSFGSYNETYGTLGAAVVLLLWFWLTALVVIVGAELNEAIQLRPFGADIERTAERT